MVIINIISTDETTKIFANTISILTITRTTIIIENQYLMEELKIC